MRVPQKAYVFAISGLIGFSLLLWAVFGGYLSDSSEEYERDLVSFMAVRNAVVIAQASYFSASNQLQKSDIRKIRDDAVSRAAPYGQFHRWPAIITSMWTNRDGDASLSVKLDGCKCSLETRYEHMIELRSKLFDILKDLREGDHVLVSGQMFREGSLTERGSVREPEWISRFDEIIPAPLPRSFALRRGDMLPRGIIIGADSLPEGYEMVSGMNVGCPLPECHFFIRIDEEDLFNKN